jgi:hypothetical protein
MLKKMFTTLVMLFSTISISFADSVPNMQEGRWEITTEMEMPGMPMKMPPMTHTQCLTKEDLVPQSSQSGDECKITNVEVSGDTVTWVMQCKGQGGETKGNGEMIYSGTSFKGTIKMIMVQSNMQMTSNIKGSRIGNCN